MTTYAPLLLLAFAGECPIAIGLGPRVPAGKIIGSCLLINLVTHPAAVVAYTAGASALGTTSWTLGGLSMVPFVLVELAVAALETVGYRLLAGVSWKTAALIATSANAATAVMSFVLGSP